MAAELKDLLQPEVQDFILQHAEADEKALVLQRREIHGVSAARIAQQLSSRRKAKDKLPTFFQTRGIIYPPTINLEQCSSELTALLKQRILQSAVGSGTPALAADLTGGFGVDSFFISRGCGRFFYVEPNPVVLEIAHHNHKLLGADMISHCHTTAQEFVARSGDEFSFIYLDPSRRKENQKVFRLSECEPNPAALLPLLFGKTAIVMIKTSPLLDLQQGVRELQGVEKIIVVAVKNECREVLFLCRRNFSAEPEIECINLNALGCDSFRFRQSDEKGAVSRFSDPLTYLYEPNASILKGGAFKSVGERYDLFKLGQHTHLFTSHELRPEFPGRIFRVEAARPNLRKLYNYFPNGKANVITRNYPLTPEAVKKKYKLSDGGEKFLIGCSGVQEKFLMVVLREARERQ